MPVPRWKSQGIHWGDDNERDAEGNPDTRYCVTLQHTEARAEVVGQLAGWGQFPSDRERCDQPTDPVPHCNFATSPMQLPVAGAEDGVHIPWERASFEQREQNDRPRYDAAVRAVRAEIRGVAAGAQGDAGAAPVV